MTKGNLIILALTAVVALSTAPMASAADLTTNTTGIINFDALDTDHDGTLTQTEFDANSSFKGQKFSDLDKNDNGSIDGAELSTWARVHGKGNAVGSTNARGMINSTTGIVGGVAVPPVVPNVNVDATGTVRTNGAGAAIGAKGNVSGSTPSNE